MRSHPDYKGDAYLLAHVIDAELRRHCIDLIPSEYATRIKLPDVVPNALRDKMISRSITVVPSAYESFCLAAYEASCLGALVVLNEENVAFGQDTPWRNGENCVKFDGTSHGLVAALASMWRDRVSLRLSKVELLPPQSPYWVASELSEPASAAVDQPSLSASAIVFSNDDYGDPLETIASLMLVSGVDLEITLVEEGPSRIAGREEVLSRLRHSPLLASGPIKIVTLGFHGGEAALINAGIQSSTRDIVVIARAGAKLDADYLRDSLRALVRSPDYDIVVSQRARDKSILGDTPPMFIGEALSSASGSNSCGEFEMVARRSVFQRVKFDEALDRFVDWDFHMRACIEGFRYIVANDAGVQLDSPRVRHGGNFRSHFENLLAKHSAVFPGGRISLVSVYEGKATEHPGRPPAEMLLLGRPVDYYTTEERPWWKLALLRPLRLPRWALLREFQRRKNKR